MRFSSLYWLNNPAAFIEGKISQQHPFFTSHRQKNPPNASIRRLTPGSKVTRFIGDSVDAAFTRDQGVRAGPGAADLHLTLSPPEYWNMVSLGVWSSRGQTQI